MMFLNETSKITIFKNKYKIKGSKMSPLAIYVHLSSTTNLKSQFVISNEISSFKINNYSTYLNFVLFVDEYLPFNRSLRVWGSILFSLAA